MSAPVPALPPGYAARPATAADVPAVGALVAACERDLYGRTYTAADAEAAVFARPGLDPVRDTLLVHVEGEPGTPVARAWVNRRSEVDVHPGHRGRGLGAALLDWTETRAREAGAERLAQTVADADAAATALVRSRGFSALATSWLLEYPFVGEPEPPAPGEGVEIRAYRPEDGPAVHRVTADAFADWSERRQTYEEWRAHAADRADFTAEASPVVLVGGEVVGAAMCLDAPGDEGYVESLAVLHAHRGRGLARLMLGYAFAAFHRRGRVACTLWTHSGTGALALYERVGMTVRLSSTVHAKPLA